MLFAVLSNVEHILGQTGGSLPALLDRIVGNFLDGAVATLPRVLAGLVFLTLAYVGIKLVLAVVRTVLERVYLPSQTLIVDLAVAVAGLVLWFGVALVLLDVVGFGAIATSLGTSAGFVGLGVAFALKEMIADTVAGVYLLQDPDFNEGDEVTTASVTGTVTRIDLRKTRLRTPEGDLVVLANRDVEAKWTQEREGSSDAEPATSSA